MLFVGCCECLMLIINFPFLCHTSFFTEFAHLNYEIFCCIKCNIYIGRCGHLIFKYTVKPVCKEHLEEWRGVMFVDM